MYIGPPLVWCLLEGSLAIALIEADIRLLTPDGLKAPNMMVTPNQILERCRIGDRPIFYIGTFHSGVTVLSQQVRALNLAWAFIERRLVPCTTASSQRKIAIVGAGFSGMTFAAALLEKQVHASITIFEKRDTLLPLQQGSDSRWLHPGIYNWPGERSQSTAAMLPVLNWTAGRASDVTVQILGEWKRVVGASENKPLLYCNSRHLQIEESSGAPDELFLEWVGEERNSEDGTMTNDKMKAVGRSEKFDFVVLAIGFGLERSGVISYWRNDMRYWGSRH